MDIIVLIFLFMCLYMLRYKKEGFNDNYLSKNSCNALRGICSVTVILHHLSQRINDGKIFKYFGLLGVGYSAVAVFFFISGYGLIKQYLIKGEKYIDGFLYKRMTPIIKSYLIISIVYFILRSYIEDKFILNDFIKSFFNGSPTVYFSWYIIEIIILYIIFFIACKVNKRYKFNIVVISLLFVLGYNFICYTLGYGMQWYATNLTFVFGMLYGIYEKEISKHINKKYYSVLFCNVAIFFIVFVLSDKLFIPNNFLIIKVLLTQLCGLSFSTLIFTITRKLFFKKSIFENIGKISLEVYLLQGIPMFLLRSKVINIKNDVSYVLLTLFITIILSVIFNKTIRLISRNIKKETMNNKIMQ